MIFKFQRAQRVRNAFDGVRNGVRKVVHGIDAPRVARFLVRFVLDAVQASDRAG